MGIPGPKPKPPEVKELEGNPGKRPLPERIVMEGHVPPALADDEKDDLPEHMLPPDHLPNDAKDVWMMLVPDLRQVGILHAVDRLALEAMTVQFARARSAGRVIARRGMTARGSTGQITEHPAVKMERQAHKLFLQFSEHFGITPTARTRLGLQEMQRQSAALEVEQQLGKIDLTPKRFDSDTGQEVVDGQVAEA